MLKGSVYVMALKIFGEVFGLFMIILVSNFYSVADTGTLLTLQNNLLLFGTIGMLGLETCFHRFVPLYVAGGQIDLVRGLQRWVFGISAICLSGIALVHTGILLVSQQTPEITTALAVTTSLAVVAWAEVALNRHFMRALGLTFWAEFSYQVIRPLGGCIILLIGALWGASIASIVLALLLPLLVACAHDTWRLSKQIGGHTGAASYDPRAKWTEAATSYAFFTLSRVVLQRLDLFVVTLVLGLEAAAVYGLTSRLASLALLAVDPISAVFLPRASLHHAQGQTDALRKDIIQSVIWISLTALIVVLVFLISAPLWIALFGNVAVNNQSIILLFIFLAGYFVFCNGSVASSVLLMTGHEATISKLNSILVLVVYPPLLLIGIWTFDVYGAAIATVLLRSLIAVIAVYLAKTREDILALPVPTYGNLKIAFSPIFAWLRRRF